MDLSQVPEMPLLYKHDPNQLIRVAEEGEEPSYSIGPQHTRPVHSSFYKDVIFSREEAVAFFTEKNNQKKMVISYMKAKDAS